jgi:hypothetical protein
MKILKHPSIAAVAVTVALVLAACSTTKKSSNTSTASNNSAPSPTLVYRPGTYAPGNEELVAIQKKYQDATMEQLNEGHILYTQSACIGCHNAKDIYKYNEVQWVGLIDDMAFRARISPRQKDALTKYVFAIKANQPKGAN